MAFGGASLLVSATLALFLPRKARAVAKAADRFRVVRQSGSDLVSL